MTRIRSRICGPLAPSPTITTNISLSKHFPQLIWCPACCEPLHIHSTQSRRHPGPSLSHRQFELNPNLWPQQTTHGRKIQSVVCGRRVAKRTRPRPCVATLASRVVQPTDGQRNRSPGADSQSTPVSARKPPKFRRAAARISTLHPTEQRQGGTGVCFPAGGVQLLRL